MNEMKPEDVMRALECCVDGDCYPCPYGNIGAGCRDEMSANALALLREKDAEIKELTDDNKWSAKRIIETDKLVSLLKAENERLNKHQDTVSSVCNSAMEHDDALYEQAKDILKAEARAEAIDEFAERLKKYYDALKSGLVSYHIDQIAKEMKANIEIGR